MTTAAQVAKVSDARDEATIKLLASISKTIGLVEWSLQISPEQPSSEDAMAEVECTPHRRIATVRLCHDFTELGHEQILHVLVHEMLHLYFADIKQAIEDLSEYRVLGNEAHSVLEMTIHHYEEVSVDQMAVAWSALMWEWESVQKALRKITKQVERTAR